jgi:capsular polysaccharide biosynthesis protein
MTVSEERRVRPVDPDLDAEQEIDLGRYGRTLAQRWWLPLLGLVAGAIVGYLLSFGGGSVFRAQALVYLGQPLGILGGNAVQSPNTNPSTARAIVKSESVIQRVARDVGLPPAKLRGGVSATPVQGANARLNQNPLVQVTVKTAKPAKARRAANQLAQMLVDQLSAYARVKVRTLSAQLAADKAAIDSINAALADSRTSFDTKLLLQIQLAQRQTDATQTEQLLSLARNVESPRILTHAAASETAARSRRNSIVVGGLIGLILGGIAAFLWDPLFERRARR